MTSAERRVHAVLQAGGRGQRMREASSRRPKPLQLIAGIPMIERVFEQVLAAGIRKITVITGWLGEQIEDHLTGLHRSRSDLQLEFLREPEPRGNAGSLAHLPPGNDTILFTFTDLVTTLDLAALFQVHAGSSADLTLASHYETHRLRLGELLVEDERVVRYFEKPEKTFLICSGIALIEPAVLKLLPRTGPLGLVDVVNRAIDSGLHAHHWLHGAFWKDVNSEEEREAVERLLLEETARSIAPSPG